MTFLVLLDSALVVVLFGFNCWQWFLAMCGLTTIEFWDESVRNADGRKDWAFKRVRDNLFRVFGTKSYFQLLSPSMRYIAFTGLEWSFQLKDLGYDEDGKKPSHDNDDEI